MNIYIWRRFLRLISHAKVHYLIIIPILLMAGDGFFILDIATGVIPDSPALYFISSSFVGVTFMLFVVAIVYDLSITVSKRVPVDQSRRRTLKLIFDVTMLVAAIAYLLRGFSQGVKFPGLNRVQVRLKDFPLERFNLVQLTDVHVGRTIKRDFIERLVAETNQLNPDMVVITGDLVDLPVSRIEYDLFPLKDLKAPTYFILGNHEYFHGVGEAVAYIRELGIIPLLNEHVVIGEGEQQFNLVGLNDITGIRTGFYPPDKDKAFAGADQDKCCIVLAHQPRMITEMDGCRCDLMLSGHTHGGQIFPFGLLVMAAQPYLAGLHSHTPEQQIFVSRGTGYWGPPLRFLAPSEISQLIIQPT
ncbi:metallophosphoesterase [Sulfuriflexus mobilis]|uniref:metallophosphoesterase n=1 Tax=Sulfuriflexus mobilis TaxID=1811807 RepID=UPI00155902B5|nr:metallophosphoesterase [Sulfuriflexus mobilis]